MLLFSRYAYFRLDVYVVIAIRWNRLQNNLTVSEIHHLLSIFVSINSFSFLKLDILLIKYRYHMAYIQEFEFMGKTNFWIRFSSFCKIQ